MENYLPSHLKRSVCPRCKGGPCEQRGDEWGQYWVFVAGSPCWVGRQGGPGAGDKAALFRRGRERSPSAACAGCPRHIHQGPRASCSPGLSPLIYYSARLDCLIVEMCRSLHQRVSSSGGGKSVWTAIPRLHFPVCKETPSAICHHPAGPQTRLAAAEFCLCRVWVRSAAGAVQL